MLMISEINCIDISIVYEGKRESHVHFLLETTKEEYIESLKENKSSNGAVIIPPATHISSFIEYFICMVMYHNNKKYPCLKRYTELYQTVEHYYMGVYGNRVSQKIQQFFKNFNL